MNRVSRDASGSYEYYHSDGLGSTRQLSNDSQGVTQTTTYDAFGNIESSAGSSSNVYKYAGQFGYRNDGDDGLMHVGARYYDPLVGRFVQADTWLGEIDRPQSLNRYAYCEGDPVNAVDPSGHDKDDNKDKNTEIKLFPKIEIDTSWGPILYPREPRDPLKRRDPFEPPFIDVHWGDWQWKIDRLPRDFPPKVESVRVVIIEINFGGRR